MNKYLSRFSLVAFAASAFLCASVAFADAPEAIISNDQFYGDIIQSLGGFKGAGSMAIAMIVVQLVMKFFETPMASWAGKWKMSIVAGLSVALAVLGLRAQGLPLLACIVNGGVMTAVQVFAHQVVKQVTEKPELAQAAPAAPQAPAQS